MKKLSALFLLHFYLWSSVTSANVPDPDRFNAFLFPTLGKSAPRDWFEWWYTKVVDPKTGRAFFFVYGVVNPWDTNGSQKASRAYVSFGDFSQKFIVEKVVKPTEFRASEKLYSVEVGSPVFATANADRIEGTLNTPDGRPIVWDLKFRKEWSFRAMGWAMGIPGLLNIGWYPAQAATRISGSIRIGTETIEFSDVRGYQDRNWGRSFPKWWTWIVAHRFDETDEASLVVGGGAPHVLRQPSPYEGVSIGFKYRNKMFAFRPTDGTFPKADISFGKWEIKASDLHGNQIQISASAPPEKFMDLQFLSPQGQVFHDQETLNGQLHLRFKEARRDWIELNSSEAGIEYGSY